MPISDFAVDEQLKLQNKTAIITGGSKGLGKALALRFASEGANVAICSRSEDNLTKARIELHSKGAKVLALQCDIADAEQVHQFVQKVLEEFGTMDILINNASVLGPRIPLIDFTLPTWHRIIETNVHGLFYMTKAVLPFLIKQRSGSIINVTSSVGKVGSANWGAYAVSKFALEGFTQVLADEVRKDRVRVNSVNPGAMATEMRHLAYPHEDQSKLKSPDAITDVFVYLASDTSLNITGQYFEAQKFKIPK